MLLVFTLPLLPRAIPVRWTIPKIWKQTAIKLVSVTFALAPGNQ
ncbi:hypothetical protein IWX88_001977 [Frigoribacterium sp. CG_9.8]|nr:hypothetical protein [Frigoribacterium sp. CG_9.8]